MRFASRLLKSFRRALRGRLEPPASDAGENPDSLFAIGAEFARQGRSRDAIDHLEAFDALAAADDSRRMEAWTTLARCAVAVGDLEAAASWARRALAIVPGEPEALWLLSWALYHSGRLADARRALAGSAVRYATRLQRALMLPAIYDSRGHIAAVRDTLCAELEALADTRAEALDDPSREVALTAFFLAYHDANNVELLRLLCKAARRIYPAAASERNVDARHDRLRVGFVSAFFYSHSVGRVTIGHIRDLPRERFSVYVFAIAPREDAFRAEIERAADHYVRLPKDLRAARQALEAAKLDVLVFPDIGMHATTYFLAMSRLAPVQVATWGHPETTGIDTVDYYLSADAIERPDAQAHYTERLVRPNAFFLPGYEAPVLTRRLGRAELGLPADKRLYACFQQPFKLHPDIDEVFHAILEKDDRAEILLRSDDPRWVEQLRRRYSRRFGDAAERIRFRSGTAPDRYLATLAACDVVLDPLYFGGGNSSCDAICAGTPVITLPGAHLYGRLTLGLLREMELEECIATSHADFADRAVQVATEPDLRHAIAAKMRERSGRLFGRTDHTLAFAEWMDSKPAGG